jgi:DNA-cytosine methyltransferase
MNWYLYNLMLSSLDLFSGIGGMTLALHGAAKPLLYCDKLEPARDVLRANIKRGLLPDAPILEDVRDLSGTKVPGKVDLVCAGFPCVGFSSAGSKQGFRNEHTNIYHELVRVLGETQPSLAFLENVPGVLAGFDQIREDFLGLGYSMAWCMLSCNQVGGYQRRKRWFALAFRDDGLDKVRVALSNVQARPIMDWKATEMPKKTTDQKDCIRPQLLGNSVVPDVARVAFRFLCKVILRREEAIVKNKETNEPDEFGYIDSADGKVRALSKRFIRQAMETSSGDFPPIVLDPSIWTTDKPPISLPHYSGFLTAPVTKSLFATPRFGNSSTGTNYLTKRALQDLQTQVRFVRDGDTKHRFTNPEFVEWLMGFPSSWTKTS